ncbi:MAG: ssDNA-binding domain-containing protein [Mucispirillum sp.]|nr:ssDNA-binding domain-containing protein [Mucispirillum sp.]
MSKMNQYRELANKFAELIEKNEAPWQKSWNSNGFLPYNIKTGREYNGINLLNLMSVAADKGYEDSRWLTFLQAGEQEAKVRAGEKGVHIMYLQTTETKKEIDEITGEEIVVIEKLEKPRAVWSVVFNAEQCEGLPALEQKQIDFNPIERAEEILNNSGAKIKHKAQDRAYYSPVTDTITLPLKEQFISSEEYYRTALHELGHWTGHSSRNNRDMSGTFGTESYAKEELVAEITSFLVGTQCGLGHEPDKNNIAYLKSWSKAIRDEPSFLFNAVKEADRAAKLILGNELILENDKEKGFFKDLVINFAWSEMDFGIKDDTILRGEEAYKFLDKLVKSDTEQHKIQERIKNGENIDEAYYYKTRFVLSYKGHNAESLRIDIGDYEFGGKEKVSDALEDRAKMYPNELIPNNELQNFKKEEDRYLEYLQQINTNEQTMEKETPENKIDKDINDRINSVTYINVPKVEKDEVKSLGAKWDRNNVCWFVPADIDAFLFNKWEKIDEKDLAFRKDQMQQNKNKITETQEKQEEKYILAVPYDEKDQAKALGAEWDKDGKFWYCRNEEKDKFFKWDIKNVENKVQYDMPLNIEEEFLDRIKSAGVLENTVIADGQKHRISVDGDKGNEQSGFYVLHSDGVANGYFMNNRTGEEIRWSSKEHSMTAEEKAEMKALYQDKKAEREQQDKILTEKAEKAIYAKFMNKETVSEHTYLSNKMIEPTKNIYAGQDSTITIPLFNIDGRLKSAQYIDENGEKRFAKNTNKVGVFHIVDGSVSDLKSASSIIIAEGYATAASINEAVNNKDVKVIAAMSANNLEHTIKAITNKYPDMNIIIAADNDLKNQVGNIGLNAANAVQNKYKNITVTVPKINGKEVAGDFNDIVSKYGLSRDEALKNIHKSLQAALKLDKIQKQEKKNSKLISAEKTNDIKKENKERVLSR